MGVLEVFLEFAARASNFVVRPWHGEGEWLLYVDESDRGYYPYFLLSCEDGVWRFYSGFNLGIPTDTFPQGALARCTSSDYEMCVRYMILDLG